MRMNVKLTFSAHESVFHIFLFRSNTSIQNVFFHHIVYKHIKEEMHFSMLSSCVHIFKMQWILKVKQRVTHAIVHQDMI